MPSAMVISTAASTASPVSQRISTDIDDDAHDQAEDRGERQRHDRIAIEQPAVETSRYAPIIISSPCARLSTRLTR